VATLGTQVRNPVTHGSGKIASSGIAVKDVMAPRIPAPGKNAGLFCVLHDAEAEPVLAKAARADSDTYP